MKVLTRKLPVSIKKAAGAARRGAGGVFRSVQGIVRLPKIIGKRRMSQSLMVRLNKAADYSPIDITQVPHRPGHKTYGYKASNGFHIEVVDARGFSQMTVEERFFNREGLLTRLIVDYPGEGRYIWDYRKPGQWRGIEQGKRKGAHMRIPRIRE